MTNKQLKQLDALEVRLRKLVESWRRDARSSLRELGKSPNEFNAEFLRGAARGVKVAADQLEKALKQK